MLNETDDFSRYHIVTLTPKQKQCSVSYVTTALARNGQWSAHKLYSLNFQDGLRRVWRRTGERYHPPAMIAHDRYGDG